MPYIREVLTRYFVCSLCPVTGTDSGETKHMQNPGRLPAGWTWAVRPRHALNLIQSPPTLLGMASGDPTEPLLYLCPTCTKRVDDAMTPHPERKSP